MNIRKLFSKPQKATRQNGFYSTELESGDMLCSIENPIRAECLLRPCEFNKEAYYFVNALELPRSRHIALEAASSAGSINFSPSELTDALAEIIKAVQTHKKLSELRIDVQRRCDAIAERAGKPTMSNFLEEISLIFMVIKGENPFTFSDAWHDRKRGILNTEPYAKDFFFQIARQTIASYQDI